MRNEAHIYKENWREVDMKRTAVYPFTAIVGQEDMKMALILNVINPALGSVD